jgi:ankyrin repeat protein
MEGTFNFIRGIKSQEELKECLKKNGNLNLAELSDKDDNTLLHISARTPDNLTCMKIYIEHYKKYCKTRGSGNGTAFQGGLRAWVNKANKDGNIPLFYASYNGDTEMIRFLEDCGSNMHHKNNKNESALFMCIERSKTKAMISLLESANSKNKYNINEQNCNGDTVLHAACARGSILMVSYLLTRGAKMESANK